MVERKETADEKLLRQYRLMVDTESEPVAYWLDLLEKQTAKLEGGARGRRIQNRLGL